MENQNIVSQITAKLQNKTQESPLYRKTQAVLQSLIEATKAITNFNNLYANNNRALALYLSGGTFKLLKKVIDGQSRHQHQLDAYLLLLSLTLPDTSLQALIQGGLLQQLRNYMRIIIQRKQNSPLMTRLAFSILSHTLSSQLQNINFRVGDQKKFIIDLFYKSVKQIKGNALGRQSAKMLVHLMKSNSSVSTVLAQQAKSQLLTQLQQRQQLYLGNIKQVIAELPVRLINDICHRIGQGLNDIDSTDANNEQYLAHTYFFLQKMMPSLLSSTLQDLLLVLISNVPSADMSQKTVLSYIQLLYQNTLAMTMDEEILNRLLSSSIAIMMELISGGGKIAKFATNQIIFLIQNCVRSSLWRTKQSQLSLQKINLQSSGHNFQKIICLFKGMMSNRFPFSIASQLISQFIGVLEPDAFVYIQSLIQDIVSQQADQDTKDFRRIIQSILLVFGAEIMMKMYPITLDGDLGHPSFEKRNHLWLLNCLQKTSRAQSISLFHTYLSPLIQVAKIKIGNKVFSLQRRDAYGLIQQMIWRCLPTFTKLPDQKIDYQMFLFSINNELKTVSQNTLQQLTLSLQQISNILIPSQKKSNSAQQLIKTLAGLVSSKPNSVRHILKAIRQLAKIAPVAYVKRVFDLRIQQLIDLAKQKKLNVQQTRNIRNIQILMAVNGAIDLRDPSVTTKYKLSRGQLVNQLVSQLISWKGIFQKKGYKYLSQVLVFAPNDTFLQALQLLQRPLRVDNASKHHRLSAIAKIWSWLRTGSIQQNLQKMVAFIRQHLPQILITLRQPNKGARKQAQLLIQDFSQAMGQLELFQSFIQTICVGLVGDRSQMKLSTLAGITTIIAKHGCKQQIFKQLLQIVLLLLGERKQELYRGVVQFCRRTLLSRSVTQQLIYLPQVIKQLFEKDEDGKLQHRSILRHFLIKLTKKHGRQAIQAMIPQSHRKMLTHTLKMQSRQIRKKKQLRILRAQKRQQQKKQKQNADSSSDQQQQQNIQNNNNDKMQIQQEQLQQLDNTNNLLLKYDLQQQKFHFQKQIHSKKIQKKTQKKQDGITFDDKGIMIIQQRKRPVMTHQEQQKQEINKPLNFKKKAKVQIHQVKQSGASFKSSRGQGDIKKPDSQPYAFIQFSSKALNKRFKKRAEQVFDTVFQKKEGGLKGLKKRITGSN